MVQYHRLTIVLAILVIFAPTGRSERNAAAGVASPLRGSAQTAEPPCSTSQFESGGYDVRVCLTVPRNGSLVTGRISVEATLEIDTDTAPPVRYLQFSFARASAEQSAWLLRDYTEPYSFTLPTERWTDGPYRLDVSATFMGNVTTSLTGIALTLYNGVSRMPVSTGGWVPYTVPAGDEDSIAVAAVGDGAGGLPGSYEVADLIETWNPDMFLYLGDVYNVGSYTEFLNFYDPTYGRFKEITNPVPGDHEGGKNFQGYLDYWNSSQHFYSVTAGSWRLIALNSTERYDGVTPGTRQFDWLKAQLAANDDAGCTLVFFHEPRWRISSPENGEYLDALWSLLVSEGVDIVLNGHEHRYERWQPMDADGVPNQTGPVEFVVGTGGHELNPSRRTDPRVDVAHTGDGAIRFDLREGAADYQFVTTANETIDAGTVTCRGGDVNADPPSSETGSSSGHTLFLAEAFPGVGTVNRRGG